MQVVREDDPELAQVLQAALERRARSGDRLAFVQQALSGMPQAILPFKRDALDIFLAAGLMQDASRAGMRGQGHAVDAGYFSCATGEPVYVDTVSRIHQLQAELVDLESTRGLVHALQAWGAWPSVEIADSAQGEIMRLRPGGTNLKRMGIEKPERPRLADVPLRASLKLLRVADDEPAPSGAATPAVEPVALGQVTLEREADALVVKDVQPEFLMELHAAHLRAQDGSVPLWLNIEWGRNHFLAPLPDLMAPGDVRTGWWAPVSDIGTALGGNHNLCAKLPRWAALRLMRKASWAWVHDRDEWVRCAWWIQRPAQAASPAPSPAPAPAPSPFQRLGRILGLPT